MKQNYRIRINHQIRVPQVKVLQDDNFIGILSIGEALKLAQEAGLDLIEINPKANPPICKIIDYGKFKYDEKKKASEAKKSQKIQQVKELSFRPNTDTNDLNHKLNLAKGFLADGDRVKFVVKFRGREITHPQLGKEKLNWIIKELEALIVPNPIITLDGKIMSMTVYNK